MTKIVCSVCGTGRCKYATKQHHMTNRTGARVVTRENCGVPKEERG